MNKIITDQEILTKSCQPIYNSEYHIFGLLEDCLKDTPNGIGLAASQIGILKKAFIIRYGEKFLWVANPLILWKDLSSKRLSTEGCLSIPDKSFHVYRYDDILVQDDIRGVSSCRGYLAHVFQHEYDHTRGITLLQSGVEIK